VAPPSKRFSPKDGVRGAFPGPGLPWAIYHPPIDGALCAFLLGTARDGRGSNLPTNPLVFGGGYSNPLLVTHVSILASVRPYLAG